MSNLTASSSSCPKCGAALASAATAGLCPRCLMAEAMAPTDAAGDSAEARPSLAPANLAPHFPQLEILECLGRGGMGVVYKARQKSLDRPVALKLLAPERVGDPSFANRFSREAHALAALNHPSIVTVYDFGQAGGFYFLLMEFVDGVTLRQLLQAGRVSSREALAIVPQICDALQYAHDQGIVHRDIKPENILLDRRGRLKVADFGLAKLVGAESQLTAERGTAAGSAALTEVGKILGTPNYMAPEQIEHPAEVDHRADIYALGVVFYQMLTGELPAKKIEPPSKKVSIDVRLDEVVLRALEKNPELRFQQASVLKTQVETIAENQMPHEKERDKPQTFLDRFDKKDIQYALAGFCGFSGLLGWWLARAYDEKLFRLFFLFFLLFGFWVPVLFRVFKRKPQLRNQHVNQVNTDGETVGDSAAPPLNPKPPGGITEQPATNAGLPAMVFALCYAGFVACLGYSAQWLPPRVASHFGWDLKADDWMPRQEFLFMLGIIPLIFPLIFLGIFAAIRYGRDFASLAAHTLRQGLWFACLFTVFIAGIQYLTVQAHKTDPPRLPTEPFLFLIVSFLLASVLFVIQAIYRSAVLVSAKPSTQTSSSNRRQRIGERNNVADILYSDRLIEISDQEIVFRCYYVPFGDKHVPLSQIESVQVSPPSTRFGSWRIWGGGLRTWFPLDWARPSRDAIFVALLRGSFMRIGFTVERSNEAAEVLRQRGLLQATSPVNR